MERHFVAGEAAACGEGQAPITAFDAAFATRDWAVLLDTLADDFVSRDHRTGWMGASDRDQYVSSMRVFAELSPDVTSENVEILAWGDHGRVERTRVCGTQRDAGPFENDFVWMLVTGPGGSGGSRSGASTRPKWRGTALTLSGLAELSCDRRQPRAPRLVRTAPHGVHRTRPGRSTAVF